MLKLIFTASLLAFLSAAPAHAINAHYRAQLERSGCTQLSEIQGCDIHKTKAQNEAAGFRNGVAPTTRADIEKFDGAYVARFPNGQRVADILIADGRVKVNGKEADATAVGDMLIVNQDQVTYTLYANGKGMMWEDVDAGSMGAIQRGH